MIKEIPNLLTLLRLVLTCLLNVYILHGSGGVSVPGVIFCIIFLTDFCDGGIARLLGNTTPFGAVFDVAADLCYIVATYGILVYLRMAPLWFLAVMIFKFAEFVVTSFFLKRHTGGQSIFVFDIVGRLAAALFYIAPLLIYVSFWISPPAYLLLRGVFLYGAAAAALVSTIYRIWRCMAAAQKRHPRRGNSLRSPVPFSPAG